MTNIDAQTHTLAYDTEKCKGLWRLNIVKTPERPYQKTLLSKETKKKKTFFERL